MESQFQKWVNLSFLAAAILIGYIAFSVSGKVIVHFDLETQVRNIELIARITSVVVGTLFFVILYNHEQANQFMNEVVVELSRVVWPTQKDTASATVVVIVMVLISGVILGFLDYTWIQLMNWVL